MAPRKKKEPAILARSKWSRDTLPQYALAISVSVADTKSPHTSSPNQASTDTLRGEIMYAIERQLKVSVTQIQVVVMGEE